MKKPKDVDEYLSGLPGEGQKIMEQIRATIKKAAPMAEEVISYGIPAYKMNGILVFFAVHPNHIGFYPTPSGIEAFKNELALYKSAKGSVQFPLDKKLPLALITKIVKYRVAENLQKTKVKKK